MQYRPGKGLTGVLFENDERCVSWLPAYRGSAVIGGIRFRLEAFERVSKAGARYLALTLSKQPDAES
jgi:hypothetical protein